MMIAKRQALKSGTSLSLDGRKCMILGVMGAGTSCIAYKAQMKITIKDQTALRTIVLKELYPAHLSIIRGTDNSLIIPDNSKAVFEEESESFVKAAVLQFEFHSEEELTNFTSDIEVVYKLNNTLYSVTGIVSGKSYDKIKPENTTDILKVVESLSHAISYYHERDYLNLDIKPSNIFYENLPGDNVAIKLFDFNTVCTKKEASQGKFSYSEGYAAPEVRAAKKGSGKFSEVGEQADIYSIGAVIFEKIMGRLPKVADQRAGKKWKLESNPYLKDVVPQLQNGITDLFRKTLAIDKKDRYSSAKELISDLKKLINLAGIKVFLKNQRISPCTPKDIYISRKDILSKISKALDEKHILYLHAIGGSGKSETAKEYAEQYADKYDFIQSVFYSDSLKETIANLDFSGLKDEDRFAHTDEDIDRLYKYKYGLLGNSDIYKVNTLLIIDNYNPTSEEVIHNQGIISRLKDLHINILFTTRVKPTDISECFDLENMVPEELNALFFRINPKDKDKPERIALVDEIIKLSYNHTMTVKLVALQSAEYMKPLEEYRNVLQEKGLNSGFESEIINEKDGRLVIEDSVYNHIRALFKLNELNPKQKYIMVNACLLPLSGLEAATFSQYIDLAHFEASSISDFLAPDIKKLVNSGWIEYADTSEKRLTAETKITLHPLICDIVKNELKPELTEDKCKIFCQKFIDLIEKVALQAQEICQKNCILPFINDNGFYKMKMEYDLLAERFSYYFFNTDICFIIFHVMHEDCYINNYALIKDHHLKYYFGIEENCCIPDGITSIDSEAFQGCTRIKTLTVPDSVNNIDYESFMGCTSLTEITLPDSISEINDETFSGCTSLKKIIIPNSITEIGNSAFKNCSSLQSITIPPSVNIIDSSTFENCTSLKEVNLSYGIISIFDCAFKNCKSLQSITFPSSIRFIYESVFENCISLEKITISSFFAPVGDKTFYNCKFLNDNSYYSIYDLISAPQGDDILQDNLAKIREFEMRYIDVGNTKLFIMGIHRVLVDIFNKNIETLNIENSITRIGTEALKDCKRLKKICIPESVTEIGDSAFENCKRLKKICIPESVTEIGDSAFENCISLEEIKLSKNITEISMNVFSGCSSLRRITIPKNVDEIRASAFENAISLKQIIIPDSVTKIGISVFRGCSSLEQVTLTNSIDEIGECAFENAISLKQIIIPDSVTKIGSSVFRGCTSLEQVTLTNSIDEIQCQSFYDCSSLKEVTIPESVLEIGFDTFFGCCSMQKITLLNEECNISKSGIGYYYEDKECLNRKNENLTIQGYTGSTAEQYAKEHGFKFVSLD